MDRFRASVLALILILVFAVNWAGRDLSQPGLQVGLALQIGAIAAYWLLLRGSAIGRYERMIAITVMFTGVVASFVVQPS